MATQISTSFPIFHDTNGQPLSNGYIYIGVKGDNPLDSSNRINVYYDVDLTIPAAQPIRTVNGYPSNNGRPAQIFVAPEYSIVVQTKNKEIVYSYLTQEIPLTGSDLPWYNATDYGDASKTVSTISTAITNIKGVIGATTPFILYLERGSWSIDSNLTTDKYVQFMHQPGAVLDITNSALVYEGPDPISSQSQIYNLIGTGTLTGNGQVTKMYPQWFGAKADGTTNDATALNDCFNSTISNVAMCPSGTYLWAGENDSVYAIDIDRNNIFIKGEGIQSTMFVGDANHHRFLRCGKQIVGGNRSGVYFEDFHVTANPASRNGTAAALRVSYIEDFGFRRVSVDGSADAGIRIDGYGETALMLGNSKRFYVDSCKIRNSYYGIEVEGSAQIGSVYNNSCKDIDVHGIRLTSSKYLTCKNNFVDNAQNGIWCDISDSLSISDNTLINLSKHGIPCGEVINTTISKNKVLLDTPSTFYIVTDTFQRAGTDIMEECIIEGNISLNGTTTGGILITQSENIIIGKNICSVESISANNSGILFIDQNIGSVPQSTALNPYVFRNDKAAAHRIGQTSNYSRYAQLRFESPSLYVNFNGASKDGGGPPSAPGDDLQINRSANIEKVEWLGTGQFKVFFEQDLIETNYMVNVTCNQVTARYTTKVVGSVIVETRTSVGVLTNASDISVVVVGF